MSDNARLYSDGLITGEQFKAIQSFEAKKTLSVHWELTTILYAGILLLTSGAGILIYKNIDTIGHQVILALIAAACAGCFYYAFKNRLPFSKEESVHPSAFFDYAVLLGCLLSGIFTGYIQYQYNFFGYHYGVASLIPTILFFICAYVFDHRGVLSLGITGLAGWAGFSVTPLEMLANNNFYGGYLIRTAIILGVFITLAAFLSDIKNFKRHFSFTYNNFSANMLFIAALYALFSESLKPLSFLFLSGLCVFFIRYAVRRQSLLFLLLSVIYGYIGLTYSIFSGLMKLNANGDSAFILGIFYVFASCAGIVLFFVNYKSILRIKK